MDEKVKYYKAMNFLYEVGINCSHMDTPCQFWVRLDAITTVALFDRDILCFTNYAKLVHHRERLYKKYSALYYNK